MDDNGPTGRRLNLYRSLWGLVDLDDGYRPFPDLAGALRQQNYHGVECSVGLAHRLPDFAKILKAHQLKWIPVVFSCGPIDGCDPFIDGDRKSGPGGSWPTQLGAWQDQMMAIRKLGIDGHIAAINSFSGHDSMEFDDAVSLLNAMHDWYDEVFVGQLAGDVDRPRLLHETHRGRLLYSPWVTRRLLDAVPRLNLVADLSHWTCVAEFPLGPSPLAVDRDSLHRNLLAETIREIVPRIYHVQGRVGYEQGPQVDDPRQPEWAPQLSSFEYWWDLIFTNLIQKDQMCSFTAEHGPPPYQRSLPNRSHRDLLEHVDDVNQWIGARQAQRFIAISASIAAPK